MQPLIPENIDTHFYKSIDENHQNDQQKGSGRRKGKKSNQNIS